jgi:hypothetical protein
MTRTRRTISLVASLVLVMAAFVPAMALADDTDDRNTTYWEGNGEEHLPCDGDTHWVFNDGTVEDPVLTVDGETYEPTKEVGAYHFYTGPTGSVNEAYVTYRGEPRVGNDVLTISSCDGVEEEDEEEQVDEPDAKVIVTLAKEWTGDLDRADVHTLDVTFTIDGHDYGIGDTLTVDPGQKLHVTETVSGLEDACDYDASGLSHETAHHEDWSANEQQHGERSETFTVTNHVTCEDDEAPGDDGFTLVLAKVWTGDTDGLDLDDDDITFTIGDGDPVAVGEHVDVEPGAKLDIVEDFHGELDEGCAFSSDLTSPFTVPAAGEFDDGVYTLTVTNDITCEDEVVDRGAIGIDKTAVGVGDGNTVVIDEIGGSVEVDYEFVVTNTGGTELTVDTLDDTTIGDLFDAFVEEHGSPTLGVEDEVIFVASAMLSEDDFDEAGEHTNVVTVTTEEGPEAEADETVTLVGVGGDVSQPGIQLDKTATGLDDGRAVIPLGRSVDVDYEFVVTNTGNVDLELTELEDSHIGDLLPAFAAQHGSTTLTAEDGPVTFVATATLTEDDVDTDGTHTNVARVETAQGVSDEARETIDVLVVGDRPQAERPDDEVDVDRDDDRVVVIAQPDDEDAEVLGVALQADELPRTGDSLLGMALAALVALGLGGALLKLQPARVRSRTDGDGSR